MTLYSACSDKNAFYVMLGRIFSLDLGDIP